jgi:RimJ/RimL family protein N-acetyltransferase
VIETPRTIIRPYEGSEAPLLLPIFSDPTTMSFWSRPLDKDAVAAWVARAAQEFRQTGMGRMLVEACGGCCLRREKGGIWPMCLAT